MDQLNPTEVILLKSNWKSIYRFSYNVPDSMGKVNLLPTCYTVHRVFFCVITRKELKECGESLVEGEGR